MWAPIVEFAGRYEVSDDGRVRSTDETDGLGRFHPATELYQGTLPNGYKQVRLRQRGERKAHSRYVHRLVATAFLPEPIIQRDGRLYVNHRDGVKSNNRLDNLEWSSAAHNAYHAVQLGLRARRFSDYDIREIRRHYAQGATMVLIGEAFGCSAVMVGKIIRGESYAYVEGERTESEGQQGQRHSQSRFTTEDVQAMRRRSAAGESNKAIANDYDVSYKSVWNIVNRHSWKHID